MKKGFSLLELLVVLVIVTVLVSVAVPYYLNAVESSRITEVVMLWGRQKNWANGYKMTAAQAATQTSRMNSSGQLKYFTANIVCREKPDTSELCWEAEFSQNKPDAHLRYKLVTLGNFARLGCVGLNSAGTNFCQSQSQQDPQPLNSQEQVYWIK